MSFVSGTSFVSVSVSVCTFTYPADTDTFIDEGGALNISDALLVAELPNKSGVGSGTGIETGNTAFDTSDEGDTS